MARQGGRCEHDGEGARDLKATKDLGAMRTSRNRRVTLSLRRRCKVFERSEASLVHSLPIWKTTCGIWGLTPVRVIEEAVAVLEDIGRLGEEVCHGRSYEAGRSETTT